MYTLLMEKNLYNSTIEQKKSINEQRRQLLIKLIDTHFGGRLAPLARIIERDPSYVSRMLYEEGKSGKKGITETMVSLIEGKTGFIGWFSGAEAPARPKENENSVVIPQYNIHGSMGPGAVPPDYIQVVDKLVVSNEWVKTNAKHSDPRNLAVISAYGDSMEPTFKDGDFLLIDTAIKNVVTDAVYLFTLGTEMHIKRLQRWGEDTILMISDNTKYKERQITPKDAEKFFVHGRVLFAWNLRKM